MKQYTATATCDWGYIYSGRTYQGSSFRTAFGRAAKDAHKEARKRPKFISIRIDCAGAIKKVEPTPTV